MFLPDFLTCPFPYFLRKNQNKESEEGESNMEEKYLEMSLTEKYQFLGRMKSDCEYYLGGGMKQVSHLWGKSVDHHLKCMQELLFSIPSEDRPEWLTYQDILDFSKKMDHRPVVTAQTLGLSGARFITFFGPNCDKKPRRSDEVFFSIERRNYHEREGKRSFSYESSESGYLVVTPEMEKIFNTLFRERPENRSIKCIEWNDSWNIVFEDGICISSCQCRMEKSAFAEWYRTIKSVE